MTDDIKRLLIIKVLSELLKNFNMVLLPVKNDVNNIRLYYDFSSDMVTEYSTSLQDVMSFCGLESLYYYYDSLDYDQLYEELMKAKYFNENIFESANDLIINTENKELKQALKGFMEAIISTHDSYKTHYLFTKNSTIHMKSFDYFFGTEFEKDVKELLGSKFNSLLTFEKAKKIIKNIDKTATDKDISAALALVKYTADDYGGIKDYLSVLSIEEIEIDIAETYRQYTAKNY